MITRSLGCKKDKHDPRDKHLGVLLRARGPLALPSSADLRDARVTPRDQSRTSSCTGQSTSQGVRLAYLKAGEDCPELSALFPYLLGRAETGEEKVDGGSSLRDVIQAGKRFGFATEAAWPFHNERVNVSPSHTAYRSAFDRRGLRGYYRVPNEPDAVRSALAAGYPVVGGWQVSEAFLDWNGKDPIGVQTSNIVGGHAILLIAYEPGAFWLMNSWGTSWGRNGYALVTEDFIRQMDDGWALDVQPSAGAPA